MHLTTFKDSAQYQTLCRTAGTPQIPCDSHCLRCWWTCNV